MYLYINQLTLLNRQSIELIGVYMLLTISSQ